MLALRLLKAGSVDALRALVAIGSLAGLANALLLGMINAAAESAALGEPPALRPVVLFVVAAAICIVAQRSALVMANEFCEARLSELRLRLVDKIRRSELRILEHLGRGELYTKVAQETGHLSQSFPVLLSAAQSLFLLAACLVYIAWLSPVSCLVVATVTLLALGVYAVQRASLVGRLVDVTRSEGEMLDGLAHFLEGFQEVRLSADRSDALMGHFGGVVGRLRERVVGIGDTWVLLLMFATSFTYLLLGAIIFVLPGFFEGYTDIVYKLNGAAFFCIGPVTAVTTAVPIFAKAMVGLEQVFRLEDVLDAGFVGEPAPAGPGAPFTGFGRIELAGIVFSYRDREGRPLFTSGPWDLTLARGEILFLTGGNGCGKSTALKLLCGLYRPERGTIAVDGVPVEPGRLGDYRALFSGVFSDFHLFAELHGLPGVDPARVEELLRRMELADKVRFEGGRFSTLDLSTGQRKRLAMVVALLEDREVLVLDEWAADQEARMREAFYLQLLPELKARGKTVVVVTHDDRYFHACDRLVKLDLGSIVLRTVGPAAGGGPGGAPCPS